MGFLLFASGAAVGSFLKAIADRYDPDLFLWSRRIIGGRSHCPYCHSKLRWFELVPIMSYLWQYGRCRTCNRFIDWQCPVAEIVSGILFVVIPYSIQSFYFLPSPPFLLSLLWISVFSLLLLMALIDFRLHIIPDEIHVLLAAAAIGIILLTPFGPFEGSFLGSYADLFAMRSNVWVNHLFGALIGGAFFGILVLASRGRAMGAGDFKLAAALGLIFGWPDILLILVLAFIIGSFAGIAAIAARKKGMKSRIAFGPFLAAGALAVFLFGYPLIKFYFSLFGLGGGV